MDIRVVIMDIDGTLVGRDGIITKETRETLCRAQDQGVRLVLASGRPISGMLDLARELEMDRHHGICVCYNGSRAVDVESGEVLFNQTMTVEEGKAVLHHMKQFSVRPLIVRGDYAYVENVYDCMVNVDGKPFNMIDHEAHDNHLMLCEVRDLEEFLDWPANKILNIGEAEYLAVHHEEMAAPFKGTLNSMFTAPFYYEFTAKDVDKVKALESVLTPLGYSREEMIAFGDAQNDMAMIRYAGIGVAMGNAVEELKAAADEVTGSCAESGIAQSLKRHFCIDG